MKGPKESYVQMLDQVLVDRAAEAKSYHPLRPSAAGYCARKLAHDLMGYLGKAPVVKEERKPSVERLLGLGHYVEEQVAKDLKGIPGLSIKFQQQVVDFFTLSDGTRIEGSTDFVTWNEETRGLLDAKTVGDRWHSAFASKWEGMLSSYARMSTLEAFGWKQGWRGEQIANSFWAEDVDAFLAELGTEDALYKNIVQVNGYACTPFMQSRGIDHGAIIRYNKNNSELMEIRFKPSLKLFKATQEKFERIVAAVAEGNPELVDKERAPPHVDCAYCPYRAQCWPTTPKGKFYKGEKVWPAKSRELEKHSEVEEMFARWEELEEASDERTRLQQELVLMLDAHGVEKVQLDNGTVFEVKSLKAGPEIRRSKA